MAAFTTDLEIVIDLSDIASGIRKINNLEKYMDVAVARGLQRASDQVVRKLMFFMDLYKVPSLKSGIFTSVTPSSFTIMVSKIDSYSNENYAMFVEYGTGIVGESNPHPLPVYDYDSHNHGDDGWWYPTDEAYPNQPTWIDPSGQLRAWTKGMPARPFLFRTLEWMKQYNPMKREINKELKRLIS